jgi:hypothetical protein
MLASAGSSCTIFPYSRHLDRQAITAVRSEEKYLTWARVAAAEGVSRAELIRELIDRAIGDSFGVLAGQEAFTRTRDQRMDYLDRLADE